MITDSIIQKLLRREATIRNLPKLSFLPFWALTMAALIGFFIFYWYPFLHATSFGWTVTHAKVIQKQPDVIIEFSTSDHSVRRKLDCAKSGEVGANVWIAHSPTLELTCLRTPGTWKAFAVSAFGLVVFMIFWTGVWFSLLLAGRKIVEHLLNWLRTKRRSR